MNKTLITSALILGSVVASQAANLIVNGDFETGMSGSDSTNTASSELGTFQFGPPSWGSTIPTGWTINGTRNWSVTDNGATVSFPTANGDYAMRLDADATGGIDYLSQTGISLTAGTIYTFKIDMWSEYAAGGSDLDAFLVDAGGANLEILDNYVDSVSGLETVTKTFTVGATGTYELRLQNENQITASDANHTWVDNVSIEAVPEPSSAALLGLGGLALILRRRKG